MGSSSAWFCAHCCGRGELFTFLHRHRVLWPTADARSRWGARAVTAPQAADRIPGTAEVNGSAHPTGPSAYAINLHQRDE